MTTRHRLLPSPQALPRAAVAVVCLFLLAGEAGAMGKIKIPPGWTNQPPVVVTNAPPPVVTNAPPPVAPQQPLWAWRVREFWTRSLPWKAMFVLDTPKGVLLSTYNRTSRVNSEVHLLAAGEAVPRNIYRGTEETIGELPTPAAVRFGDLVVCAAERGKNVILFEIGLGRIRAGAKIPDGYKWNVFAATWRGRPVVGGDGPETQPIVFDGLTGAKLATSPLNGLIAGMAEAPGGALWLAISDGQKGLAEIKKDGTAGATVRDIKPASVAWWNGALAAGSMVDGKVWRVVAGRPEQIADLKCSKINRMVADPRRGVLLLAGAKPDTFAALHPDGRMEQIARFTDEKQEVSGEQFDADISPGPGDSILFARAHGKGCSFYEARPIP